MPPVPVPGHSSYPSGHATQARLIALCMTYVLGLVRPALPAGDIAAITETLAALARRVARNREIAGLHFPSDSQAGQKLAEAAFAALAEHGGDPLDPDGYTIEIFGRAAITAARREWDPGRGFP
jgi:membrane-associated phospholipid phosphatase